MIHKKIFFPALLSLLASASPALAQPDVSGDIEFSDAAPEKSPYATSQDEAIDVFTKAQEASQTGAMTPAVLSTKGLQYLTGVYLLCSVKQGTCPAVLDGLLELDVINSKVKGTTECHNLTGFWSQWAANSMEERHQYLVLTGYVAVTDEFKKNVRPKYLKCQETVAGVLKGSSDASAFFTKRYAPGSAGAKILPNMVTILTSVKAKVPDVFRATGTASPFESARRAEEPGKKTGQKGRTR